MAEPRQKVYTVDDLREVREGLRAQKKVVVQCHGCFDIVHPGHIRYLRFAREQGDVLIVSISGDDAVNKGFDRPYINESLRAENLAALEFVDFVCIDHHTWGGPVLEKLQPDIYVKGKEYETNADPRFLREKELVERNGGKVIFSSGDVVYSSSFIISQFRERFSLEQQKIDFYCKRHGLNLGGLEKAMTRFADLNVLVVGDPIMDHYIHCESPSVAAESPILSVTPIREEWYVGGSGLVALQMAQLGAGVCYLTPFSDDSGSERLARGLDRPRVEHVPVAVGKRPVYEKTRYLVDNQKLLKVNQGRYAPLSSQDSEKLAGQIRERMEQYDALVVCDFGYGLFGSELVSAINELPRTHGKPFYLDVSHTGYGNLLKFREPRLATPTENELRYAFGDQESGLSNLAARYFKMTGAGQLVLTMGDRGVLYFTPPAEGTDRLPTDYLPIFTRNVVDTVGAGDVFLAATVLSDLAQGNPEAGLYLGSCLAALHIGQSGNDPRLLVDLQGYLSDRPEWRP